MRRVALLALFWAATASARSISWRSFDVTAHLDRDGRLHVRERQTLVFDGDYNGGQRVFRLQPWQRLIFHGMVRVDDGRDVPMPRGHLDQVDHWDFTDAKTLRWRARRPEDPPFEQSERTYVLDFMYENIVTAMGGGRYRFAHDFAFTDREGNIEHFTLHLTLDPVWNAPPLNLERGVILPGDSEVVSRTLTYGAATPPAAAYVPPSPMPRVVAIAAVLALVLLLVLTYAQRERETLAAVPLEDIDTQWIERQLLSLRPEVAGAALHGRVGAEEVAAVLARLTQEGKLATTETSGDMTVTLLVPRDRFSGYERQLVDALIPPGTERASASELRERHGTDNFDPANEIRAGVEEALRAIEGWGVRRGGWRLLPEAAVVWLATGAAIDKSGTPAVLLAIAIVFTLFGAFAAAVKASFRTTVVLLGILAAVTTLLLSLSHVTSAAALAAFGVAVVATAQLALDLFRWVMPAARMRIRNSLAAAQRHLAQELTRPRPRIRDEWFPYLIAFGLGRDITTWSIARLRAGDFGERSSGHDGSSSASTATVTATAATVTPSEPHFTGGGGRFGGAGATGWWAAAAAPFAGPAGSGTSGSDGSSSDSGWSSSSDSSSSDSGGGGGGGW